MLRLEFSTGYSMMVNVEDDLPALGSAARSYENLMNVPGRVIASDWSMTLNLSTGEFRFMQAEMEALRRSRWSNTMHLHMMRENAMERVPVAVIEIVPEHVELMRPWPMPLPRPRLDQSDQNAPRSAHAEGSAIDVEAPSFVTVEVLDGDVVTDAILSVEHDIPALRQWLLENVIDGIDPEDVSTPAENVVMSLPRAGNLTFTPEQIRFHAEALLSARRLGPGPDTVAVARVGDQNYVQGGAEAGPEFEQRVINDMMLRRARDLMRGDGLSPGLTAGQAAAEVRRLVAEAGVEGLVPPALEMRAPSPETNRRLGQLTVEDHQRLAHIIARWYLDPVQRPEDQALIARAGLTVENIRWFNVQVLEGQKHLPESLLEPTVMEAWRD